MIESIFILQGATNFFYDFLRNIRVVDVLDIIIIAFFLYIVLNWLRQSASRRSLLSIAVLIVIYVVARFTGMYLTERLLEGLFVVILIGFVVVFQSDMRRFFDQLGSWSFFKTSSTNSSLDIVTNTLTEALAKMAEQRTGALIAIKGSESWERHLHGGIELDGKVTIPLLHSIFNTKTPGHDGAVLLDGSKILKFGVHLPLSINLQKMKRGGTRHTAALGLAEQCDALIVVVSEERGIISIAKDGRIFELDAASDLKRHLNEFWNFHYNSDAPSLVRWWKRRSSLTAVTSGILAFILWWAFAYPSGTVFRSYSFPIEFRNLKSTHIALQDSIPSKVRVTLSGSEQAFKTFNPSGTVVSINLATEKTTGSTLNITQKDIKLPNDLHFLEASPATIRLQPMHRAKVQLPVHVPTTGHLPAGLKLVSLIPRPIMITVLLDTTLMPLDSISTEPIDLSGVQKSMNVQKKLQLKQDTLQLAKNQPEQITVNIHVHQP